MKKNHALLALCALVLSSCAPQVTAVRSVVDLVGGSGTFCKSVNTLTLRTAFLNGNVLNTATSCPDPK